MKTKYLTKQSYKLISWSVIFQNNIFEFSKKINAIEYIKKLKKQIPSTKTELIKNYN
jgi:hypothetical protein